ncbi:methylmalonyl Co-A mutase-associated GTPase MeaB [soil metagenome]
MSSGHSDDPGARLVAEARAGDRRALARLLTEMENRTAAGEAAVRILYREAGGAHLVGLTGPPGVGKSTLVAGLVAEARTAGRSVAVLAIDPSSPITGGALLGDRVRMQQHAGDDGVFIRSMAARGRLGGLAGATAEAASAMDACGFGLVLIETVGTGQSEVEVASLADTTVVLQAPDMGDEVQALKAGLLEVADLVVVSRADRPGAQRAAARLRAMLGPSGADVLLASGTTGEGVAELLVALDRHAGEGRDSEDQARARLARARAQVEAIVEDRTRARSRSAALQATSDDIFAAVAAHELDPYAAADRLIEALRADAASG